jgi:uncharacterized protein
VLVVVFVRIDVTLPAIGHLGGALVTVQFLAVTMWFAARHGRDLEAYGFRSAPVRRGLAMAGIALLVIIPLFVVGYLAFYDHVCHSTTLRPLMAKECLGYHGLEGVHAPAVALWGEKQLSLEFAAVQLVVVALPEELFFRGFLLRLLEERFPPRRRWLGGGIGLALVLSAAAFALIHLPKDGDARALATFFPGLLFGWMRSATGSILASTVTHASANVLVRVLDSMVIR